MKKKDLYTGGGPWITTAVQIRTAETEESSDITGNAGEFVNSVQINGNLIVYLVHK